MARPDGKRRVHEHDGDSRGAGAQDLVLGEVLRPLVVPEEVVEIGRANAPTPSGRARRPRGWRRCWCTRAGTALVRRRGARAGCRRRSRRRTDRGRRPRSGTSPQGGRPFRSRRTARSTAVGVTHVADHALDGEPLEIVVGASGLGEDADVSARVRRAADHSGADEPGGARDEHRAHIVARHSRKR